MQYEKIIYTKDKGLNIQKKYFTDYRNDLSLVEIKKNDLNGNLIELVDIEHHLIYKYDYENNLLVSESICSSFEFDFINETYKNMRDLILKLTFMMIIVMLLKREFLMLTIWNFQNKLINFHMTNMEIGLRKIHFLKAKQE